MTATEVLEGMRVGADFGTFSARLSAPGLEDNPEVQVYLTKCERVLAESPFLRALAERELEILKQFGYVAQDATLDSLKAN